MFRRGLVCTLLFGFSRAWCGRMTVPLSCCRVVWLWMDRRMKGRAKMGFGNRKRGCVRHYLIPIMAILDRSECKSEVTL